MVGRSCTPLWWGDPALVGTLRVQKGSWARNDPFPKKKGLFLVYSTIAEIQDKFDHFGPLWWGEGDPLETGSKRADGPETARFLLKMAFLCLQHNSRNSGEI